MAVSVIETIKSRANAGNTAYIVVVKLLCDDYSDLPTQSGLSGYELAQGCIAHVINENKDYMIDSSGNWHVYGGDSWTNVYTKSETDALLDDKQDELTTAQLDAVNSGITAAKLTADEAALVELVDSGAKNIANWTAPGQTTINNVKFVAENGIVTVSLTSGTTATARSQLGLSVKFQDDLESGTYVLSGAPRVTSGGLYLWDQTVGARVTPTSDTGNGTVFTFNYDKTHTYRITVDVANGYSIPSGTTLVYKPMICTKAAWDISHTLVPYCPSMQEMYQMILALQQSN